MTNIIDMNTFTSKIVEEKKESYFSSKQMVYLREEQTMTLC